MNQKYEILINTEFWPIHFQDWPALDEDERRQRMGSLVHSLGEVNVGADDRPCFRGGIYENLSERERQMIRIALFPTHGLLIIAQERDDQIRKHGFTAAHDDTLVAGELEDAAAAILSEDLEKYPANMRTDIFHRATEKDTLGRLAVTGALVAAEMDRIIRARQGAAPVVRTLPPAGTMYEVKDGLVDDLLGLGMPDTEAVNLRWLIGTAQKVHSARIEEDIIWVRVADGIDIPLHSCTIIHDTQTTK